MKKRGFTLIELLAVIVVLAIIALIATPIVMNVIKKAGLGATKRSADNYIKAVETLIATEKLDGTPMSDGEYTIDSTGKLTKDGKEYEVEVSGTKPVGGTIVITNGQVVKNDTTIIDYEDYTVKYPNGKAEAGEVKQLAPGLYDENDNLKISWADLISTEYKSITHLVWNAETRIMEQMTSSILSVDDNGTLTSAFDYPAGYTKSSEYLVGKLVLDDSVTSIGVSAFNGCTELTSVIISDSVTSIGDSAFNGCTELTNITIGSGMTSILPNAFIGCTGLTTINVNKNNTKYDSRNNSNAIIETATNTLIIGCKDTIIPDSVTSIGNSAFYNRGLTNITIPNNVTSIKTFAFAYCTGLTAINYKGTETEWNNITKESAWDLDTPSNKKINYNYVG